MVSERRLALHRLQSPFARRAVSPPRAAAYSGFTFNAPLKGNSMNPHDYSRMMDAAKARAQELRREAVADFWSAVFSGLRSLAARLRLPRAASMAASAQ